MVKTLCIKETYRNTDANTTIDEAMLQETRQDINVVLQVMESIWWCFKVVWKTSISTPHFVTIPKYLSVHLLL